MPFVMILVASGAEMREPSLSLQDVKWDISIRLTDGVMLPLIVRRKSMKKMFLLFLIFISKNSFAQCIVQPSCADMGYTQTIADCSDGKAIKCPFDTSKVICLNQEGSSSTTMPPSTPCVNGTLVFTDGTCSYYESYETDDNPALGMYYTIENEGYAIWGGNKLSKAKDAGETCLQEGGKLFVNLDPASPYYDNSKKYLILPGVSIASYVNSFYNLNMFDYKTKNLFFLSPNSDVGSYGNYFRFFYDDELLFNDAGSKIFYCIKKL